jgi:hypothetical protein
MAYRCIGEIEWRQAKTVDISASGVLFQAEDRLPLNTPIQFRLLLPAAGGGGVDRPAEICCQGRVVRMLQSPTKPTRGYCAVAIDRYDFRAAPSLTRV